MDKELKQYLEEKFESIDQRFDTLKTELMEHAEAQTAELAIMISKTVDNHEQKLDSHDRILTRHDVDIRTMKDASGVR